MFLIIINIIVIIINKFENIKNFLKIDQLEFIFSKIFFNCFIKIQVYKYFYLLNYFEIILLYIIYKKKQINFR